MWIREQLFIMKAQGNSDPFSKLEVFSIYLLADIIYYFLGWNLLPIFIAILLYLIVHLEKLNILVVMKTVRLVSENILQNIVEGFAITAFQKMSRRLFDIWVFQVTCVIQVCVCERSASNSWETVLVYKYEGSVNIFTRKDVNSVSIITY